ncbi:MAG: peptidylprolyl isomerase [Acidimicrobiales bacterium]
MAATVALLSGLAAGCNANWSPYAAKIGGSTITPSSLDGALKSVAGDAGYLCLLGGGRQIPVKGSGDGTYAATFASGVLTNLVRSQIVEQLVRARNLPIPSSTQGVAAQQLQQSLASELSSETSCAGQTGQAAGVWRDLRGAYRDDLVDYQAAEDALAAASAGTSLRPSDLARYAAAHPSLTSQYCLSVIEVRSRAEVSRLRSAIAGGESFAAAAKAHSIDPSSAAAGGSIGCVLSSQLVAPLSGMVTSLSVGAVSRPVKYQSSFLLLLVTSRRTESGATIVAQLFTGAQSAFNKALTEAIRKAHVLVSPAYGHWSLASHTFGQVTPPRGPPAKFVPVSGD